MRQGGALRNEVIDWLDEKQNKINNLIEKQDARNQSKNWIKNQSNDWENKRIIGKSIKELKSLVGTVVRLTLRFWKTNRWQIRMNLKVNIYNIYSSYQFQYSGKKLQVR